MEPDPRQPIPQDFPTDQDIERGRSPGSLRGISPLALLVVLLITYFVIEVKAVLILVVLAFLFATLIERPVNRLQRQHIPRPLSVLIVFVVIIGAVGLATYVLVPTIAAEAELFRQEAPGSLLELKNEWRNSDNGLLSGPGADGLQSLVDAIKQPPELPEEYARGLVTSITGGIIGIVTIFVVTFYYLIEKPFTQRLILMQMSPGTALRVGKIWADVEHQLGRWLRGQISLCLIVGIASTVAYGALDVRFWPVLGLIAGITEAIPIFGPWIGGIPAVAMALTQSWEKAAMVAGVAIAIQLSENWILVPRVMKGAVGLTPLTVILAILVGTEFMGILGALLAIPIAAAIQVIVSDLLKVRRAQDPIPQSVSSWRWLGERLLPDRDPWNKPGPPPPVPTGEDEPPATSAPAAPVTQPFARSQNSFTEPRTPADQTANVDRKSEPGPLPATE